MRLAKNRTEIEASAKSASVADLTLNEAAALLMLSSDVRKVLDFARDCENLTGEEVIERCIAEGIPVISTLTTTQCSAGPTRKEESGTCS